MSLFFGIALVFFIKANGQIFDATNSDVKDPLEAKLVYPPKPTEPFMPPVCGLKLAPCTNTVYRRLDASCTNSLHPEWGVPNSTYYRLLPPRYADGISLPRVAVDGSPLPPARLVRTNLFPTGQIENPNLMLSAMQWGQFLSHDMSHNRAPPDPIKCCTRDGKVQTNCGRYCFPVKIPLNDATMGRAGIMCTNFTRTVTDRDMGCATANAPAQQINVVTSFMDLSNVYGLSDAMNKGLRSMIGGQLKVEIRNGRIFPPREVNVRAYCPCSQPGESSCYATGDSRSNQNPQLAIIQIIFVREHNRIANVLASINPAWKDETLFQEARRIMIATFQRITYYEWLPIFLGADNLARNAITFSTTGFISDHNPNVNPAVSSEHAQAAFRFFHTNIAGLLNLIRPNRSIQRRIQISDWFNRPQILEAGSSMEQLAMGMVSQNMEQTDDIFVEQITDKMLACPGDRFGIDLKATDFQRDRDHSLGYYNEYRKMCGLREARSFDDFGDTIDPMKIATLKRLYKSHLDVDLSVGGSLERMVPGTMAGPTFLCIMNDQFRRTRQSDRLFFENPSAGFTAAQLAELRKASVARLFCDNGDGIKNIQLRAFSNILDKSNAVMPCKKIPTIDLLKWKV